MGLLKLPAIEGVLAGSIAYKIGVRGAYYELDMIGERSIVASCHQYSPHVSFSGNAMRQ